MHQSVIILDFGIGSQLIARRVRECGVYCEVMTCTAPLEKIRAFSPAGIILSGLSGTRAGNAPLRPGELLELGVPVLGICCGRELTDLPGGGTGGTPGGECAKTDIEYGKSVLFEGIPPRGVCWMSSADYMEQVPPGFSVTAKTEGCRAAAMEDAARGLYGVQFHPESAHTVHGTAILRNFLYRVCGCTGDWSMDAYAQDAVRAIRDKVGDKRVLCALSGGVDSSVAAALVHKAVGRQLVCIFVDHGLMRKNEGDEVQAVFRDGFDMDFVRVNARERFLGRLAGVSDPERKRKIIGEEFIRVFEEEARRAGHVDFLVQGTIYPDVMESGVGDAAVIKSHHNVGGLPEDMDFREIIEPLRYLFKDEVRRLGLVLGLPETLIQRQPFPGPGLAVRIIGEVTPERLFILREADAILREEIVRAGLHGGIQQYFAVLTDMRSVGVTGDARTYDYTVALRGVTTTDFMTADWARIPYDVLANISNRIVSEVPHVNRIVYDITAKPPATIEWE